MIKVCDKLAFKRLSEQAVLARSLLADAANEALSLSEAGPAAALYGKASDNHA